MQQSKALEGPWFEDSSTVVGNLGGQVPPFQGKILHLITVGAVYDRPCDRPGGHRSLQVRKGSHAHLERKTSRQNGPADRRGNRRIRKPNGAAANRKT